MNYKNNICSYIIISSSFEELEKIRDFVFDEAIGFGFSNEIAQNLVLAADEACTNIIKYGYELNPNFEISLKIEFLNNQFIMKIIDSSKPFNLKDRPDTDVKSIIKQMQKGGLGIQIIKLIIDEIEYVPANKNSFENILLLKKYLI